MKKLQKKTKSLVKKIQSNLFLDGEFPKNERFMNFSLNFKDNRMEEKYRQNIMGFQLFYLKIYQTLLPLSLLCFWIVNPFDSGRLQTYNLVFQGINFFSNTLFFIYLRYKKDFKYSEFAIVFLQLYTIVGYIEVIIYDNKNFTGPSFMGTSFLLEIITLIPKNSKCRWKLVLVSSLLINIYLIIRFNNYSYSYAVEFISFPTFALIINFLTISIWSYFREKFERKSFYNNFKHEEALKKFEEIIRKILPTSIIIFREGRTLFINEETKKMLKLEKYSVEKKLGDILLTSSQKNANDIYDLNLKSEIEPIAKEESLNTNLLTYISNFEKKINSRDMEFLSLMGTMQDEESNISECDKITNSFKHLEIKLARIPWMGDDALILILNEDLSRQKLNDLEEQAGYKDKLLATVSHDLRTPLNGIIGILDLALEGKLDKDLRKILQIALRSSYLLLFMINDLLDFSQISKGTISLNPVNFDIEELTRDVVKLIKFQAKRKGISVEIFNKINFQNLFSDPNRIKQVLLNLLSNALKFTQKGSINVFIEQAGEISDETIVSDKKELELSENDLGVGAVKFSVVDSGPGIRPEDIPKLFKLFGMIRNEENKKFNKSGVGLGLAISQKLVRVLNNYRKGGEISVKSEFGKGSTFSFIIFPFEEKRQEIELIKRKSSANKNSLFLQENESIFSENKHISKAPPIFPIFKHNLNPAKITYSTKKILIVDDDQINVMVLKKFLETFSDCEFSVAFNGKDAIETVLAKARNDFFFNIIFMDCNMPIMDGFEATRILLQMVLSKQIPPLNIIASTANSSQADNEKCYISGMVDIISKPFTKKMLREKIEEYS